MNDLRTYENLQAATAAPSLPKRNAQQQVQIEESLETLSRYLDGLFRIPGTGWRFGLDSLVGLIPGVGDTATTLVSFYVLAAAVRYRVPKITILRMALNIAIDYLVGIIPFLGDLFDFAWKSNKMNIDLLKQRATVTAEEAKRGARKSDWLFVGGIMLVLLLILFGSIAASIYVLSVAWQSIQTVMY
ncbi:MAG TPA: DUF4112 domain-containing protein [Pyrinomonadaceae bacterium]|nr:DUF4112 domain-containing protein [Pyrinomonadaceae bacterium]